MANNEETTKVQSIKELNVILDKLVQYAGAELFPADVDCSKIQVSFSEHKGAKGFFINDAWENAGGDTSHTIALNPSHMDRPMAECFSTVVHEICHFWQRTDGTASRGGYHNKDFAAKMETVGLQTSSTGAVGGKTVGPRMTHYIISGSIFEQVFAEIPKELHFAWTGRKVYRNHKGVVVAKPNKSKTKFICSSCGAKAYGKPDLKILCGHCPVPLPLIINQ